MPSKFAHWNPQPITRSATPMSRILSSRYDSLLQEGFTGHCNISRNFFCVEYLP